MEKMVKAILVALGAIIEGTAMSQKKPIGLNRSGVVQQGQRGR